MWFRSQIFDAVHVSSSRGHAHGVSPSLRPRELSQPAMTGTG
ncbi:Basic proline-rich protein [Actinosynnema pretiosum subsp. pretiosum]|nr:Basic proline-rich protein [Actinosynnema pretiosum subsp. pretiosum]